MLADFLCEGNAVITVFTGKDKRVVVRGATDAATVVVKNEEGEQFVILLRRQ